VRLSDSTTGRLLWDTLTVLSTRLPLTRPVFLTIVKSKRTHGTTHRDRKGFHIEISRGSPHVMLDTLIHEYGHARAWTRGRDHGAKWGVAYAEAYRVVMGEK
jgi:hypothetical protein